MSSEDNVDANFASLVDTVCVQSLRAIRKSFMGPDDKIEVNKSIIFTVYGDFGKRLGRHLWFGARPEEKREKSHSDNQKFHLHKTLLDEVGRKV